MRSITRSLTLLAIAATAGAVPTCKRATGSFTSLALNVAGLPAFLNNNGIPDKEESHREIGRKFAQYGYDFIHVQEDFNYHAYLYETDNHPYRTPTSGGVPAGSGLNTLANYNWSSFVRVKWNDCSGYLDQSNDCLTPKGFTFMRAVIAEGVEIDLYNLHSDAGGSDADYAARSSNTQQVVDYINANSVGRAVIVYGDTNSRYTSTKDNIRNFISSTGLIDAWVQLRQGGVVPAATDVANGCTVYAQSQTCEIVDKLFYRSGTSLTLTATEFSYVGDQFLNSTGGILSDHNPILARFEYATV